MYRFIVLCLQLMPAEQTRRSLIAIRDIKFEGEDEEITRRLNHVTTVTNNLDVDRILTDLVSFKRFWNPKALEDRSKQYAASRRYSYKNDDKNFNTKVVALMQQVIYKTQERLKAMEIAVRRYSTDVRTRLAFVMCTLEEWVYQMNVMNTKLRKHTGHPVFMWKEIIYYQHFARKNIDVSYTVEYMMDLYPKSLAALGTKDSLE